MLHRLKTAMEICKFDLISDIIYFFLAHPNIIYLAQFPYIKYQLHQFWAHIRYHLSVSSPPQQKYSIYKNESVKSCQPILDL